MKICITPREDETNGWSAILPKRTPNPQLHGSKKADWLIIGAGYSGLAFARRMAQLKPSDVIIVVDAGCIGENASGRNSGFAIDTPHNVGSSLDEFKKAAHYSRILKSGAKELEEIVRANNIDCQWSRVGKYHCAASPALTASTIRPLEKSLASIGEKFETLSRGQLSEKLGTSFFHSGIYTPGCILLNPASLVRGLVDSMPKSVALYEQSPVLDVIYGASHKASLSSGHVEAANIVLATNGFIQQFGDYARHLIPMVSFGSLSAELTAEQRARIGNVAEWGVTPANSLVGATIRYTQDHRILLRQDFRYTPKFRTSIKDRGLIKLRHRRAFDRRFPKLSDVPIEYFWSGTLSITRNSAPIWGGISSNIFTCAGCNGVGILKQSMLGSLLADLAVGNDHPLISDAVMLGSPIKFPPRPFLDIGVRAFMAKESWLGRTER